MAYRAEHDAVRGGWSSSGILILISIEALPTHHCMKYSSIMAPAPGLVTLFRCRQGCLVHSGTISAGFWGPIAGVPGVGPGPSHWDCSCTSFTTVPHRLRGSASSQSVQPSCSRLPPLTYLDNGPQRMLEPPRRLGSIVARSGHLANRRPATSVGVRSRLRSRHVKCAQSQPAAGTGPFALLAVLAFTPVPKTYSARGPDLPEKLLRTEFEFELGAACCRPWCSGRRIALQIQATGGVRLVRTPQKHLWMLSSYPVSAPPTWQTPDLPALTTFFSVYPISSCLTRLVTPTSGPAPPGAVAHPCCHQRYTTVSPRTVNSLTPP